MKSSYVVTPKLVSSDALIIREKVSPVARAS